MAHSKLLKICNYFGYRNYYKVKLPIITDKEENREQIYRTTLKCVKHKLARPAGHVKQSLLLCGFWHNSGKKITDNVRAH